VTRNNGGNEERSHRKEAQARRSSGGSPTKAAKEEEPEAKSEAEAEQIQEVPDTLNKAQYVRLCCLRHSQCIQSLLITLFGVLQVEGTVYVIGTGDCGQLGLGEEVTEKMRPGPVHLPDGETVRICSLMFAEALVRGFPGSVRFRVQNRRVLGIFRRRWFVLVECTPCVFHHLEPYTAGVSMMKEHWVATLRVRHGRIVA
jgi:hypothetical protein